MACIQVVYAPTFIHVHVPIGGGNSLYEQLEHLVAGAHSNLNPYSTQPRVDSKRAILALIFHHAYSSSYVFIQYTMRPTHNGLLSNIYENVFEGERAFI